MEIVKNMFVTSPYEAVRNLIIKGKPYKDIHNGIDIISKSNEREIYALFDGVVAERFTDNTGCNVLITKHGGVLPYGCVLYMLHAHLDKYGKYKKGDKFKKGDVLGIYGSSGNVTGAHLHLSCVLIPPRTYHTRDNKWFKYEYKTRSLYEIDPIDIINKEE